MFTLWTSQHPLSHRRPFRAPRGRCARLAAAAMFLGCCGVRGAFAADTQSTFEIYGFAQADAITDTKRVDPNWQDSFRPSKIGIDGQYGTNGQTILSVKQSRFGVKGTMPTDSSNPPINFKFEFDLFGVGADAGKTTFRLRNAYGEWGSVLAGQTNSLFMDDDVFPNTIDYWGPSGMVFYRNVQIRWTPFKNDNSQFAVAVERPGNDIDSGNIRLVQGFENTEVQADQKTPDLTARYRYEGAWGHAQAAGILRRNGFEYHATSAEPWTKGSKTGWGVNLSGAFKTLARDQLLLQVVYGDGIASYMNDGGMDLAPSARFVTSGPALDPTVSGVSAEAVPLLGIVAYYDHYWNSIWSSSIGYSFTKVSNTNFQDSGAFHRGEYASANLLVTPVKNVLIGGEVLWGRRSNNNGAAGDDLRFQFSVKYNFGIKL